MQGFLFSRPLPAEEFEAILARQRSPQPQHSL
jgi:EAL domain-containing protein (putative c-di-GMP-specific phosphodiesterase class I)